MARANRHYLPNQIWYITHRCITYIDLNMVRAGIVTHTKDLLQGGYVEIQNPPSCYAIINLPVLAQVCHFKSIQSL